jgi:hypothetical protein
MSPDPRLPNKKITHLPNELLGVLSTHVRNEDLCNLALVCTKLRYPAQAALFTPLELPKRRIRHLLETLLARPDLASRIHHIDLGDYASHRITPEDSENFSPIPGDFELKIYWKFKEAITERFDTQTWTTISSLIGITDAWGSMRSFFLAVLIILAPNLYQLSFEMRPLTESFELLARMTVSLRLAIQSLGPPFGNTITHLLSQKIGVLKVARNPPGKGPYMHNLDLHGFSRLKRLSLPMETLIRKYMMPSTPYRVFPASLEHLQVLSCDCFTFLWIISLCHCRERGKLSNLRSVELFFESPLRPALLLQSLGLAADLSAGLSAGTDDGTLSKVSVARFHHILRAPPMVGIALTVHSRPHIRSQIGSRQYNTQDLCRELGIWQKLVPGEIYLAALKNVEFSEVVARNKDGSSRVRTTAERRLVLHFWRMPLGLFTSPTFEPLAWSNVRMFNGNKGTKSDPAYKPVTQKVLPKHRDQKVKTAANDYGNCKKQGLLPAKLVPPKPSALPSPTFDEASWLRVRFFQETTIKNLVVKSRERTEIPLRRVNRVADKKAVAEMVELATSWRI